MGTMKAATTADAKRREKMSEFIRAEVVKSEVVASGTCRIGRSGTKAHPANLVELTYDNGKVVRKIYPQCTCGQTNTRGGSTGSVHNHTFTAGNTGTCKNAR